MWRKWTWMFAPLLIVTGAGDGGAAGASNGWPGASGSWRDRRGGLSSSRAEVAVRVRLGLA